MVHHADKEDPHSALFSSPKLAAMFLYQPYLTKFVRSLYSRKSKKTKITHHLARLNMRNAALKLTKSGFVHYDLTAVDLTHN